MLDNTNLVIIFSFLISFLITFAATPLTRRIACKIGAVDVPKDNRRMHTKPVPYLGGLAIYYGFIVSILCFAKMDKGVIGLIIGSLIIIALGVIDDTKDLNAKVKLLFQIIAACVVVFHGVRITAITNPNIFSPTKHIVLENLKYGYFWSVLITIIWIVGVTNAVNLIDGLDGLAAGVSSIASICLLFISYIIGQPSIALMTAAIAGSCLGFLPYNFNPAKIFMGDTGAMFLGFVLATVSAEGFIKGYAVVSFAVPVLILGLPIFDTGFAIFRRIKNKKPIMQADRGHLHHRLIDMGFSQRQAVIILYTISGILGVSAVVLTGSGIIRAAALIVSILIFIVAGLKYLNSPVTQPVQPKDKKDQNK